MNIFVGLLIVSILFNPLPRELNSGIHASAHYMLTDYLQDNGFSASDAILISNILGLAWELYGDMSIEDLIANNIGAVTAVLSNENN